MANSEKTSSKERKERRRGETSKVRKSRHVSLLFLLLKFRIFNKSVPPLHVILALLLASH